MREHKNRLRRHSRKTPPPDGTRKARGTAHRIDEIEERSADDPQQRGCVQINAAAELGPHYPEFGQEIAARLDELQGFSRSMIARARADGSVPAAHDRLRPSYPCLRNEMGTMCPVRTLGNVVAGA